MGKEGKDRSLKSSKFKGRNRKNNAETQSTQRSADTYESNSSAANPSGSSRINWGKELFGEPGEVVFAERHVEEAFGGKHVDGQAAVPQGHAEPEVVLALEV